MSTGFNPFKRAAMFFALAGILTNSAQGAGEIRFRPVTASGNVKCTPGVGDCAELQIVLSDGGVDVTLFIEVSAWDPDQDGDPTLGAYQGTVDSATYAGGHPSGEGTVAGFDLVPFGQPNNGFLGAFLALKVCSNDFDPPVFEEFDELSRCNTNADCPEGWACTDRPDYVYFQIANTPSVSTAALNYFWSAASATCATDPDGGETRFYGGTLILHVPVGASGTYNVNFFDNPNFTLMNQCAGPIIPGLTKSPAQITIGTRCCFGIGTTNGCSDNITSTQCENRPVPRQFDFGKTCADPCPTCVVGVDCCPEPGVDGPLVEWLNPEDGTTDVRQPSSIDDATALLGIGDDENPISVVAPVGADPICWSLCETQVEGSPNDVDTVTDNGDDTYTITLLRAITPGAFTEITYTDDFGVAHTGSFLSLPGDADESEFVERADITAMADCCLDAACSPISKYICDINHSTAATAEDLVRIVDELNSAGDFATAWEGQGPDLSLSCPP